MKKVAVLFACALLLVSLTACGTWNEQDKSKITSEAQEHLSNKYPDHEFKVEIDQYATSGQGLPDWTNQHIYAYDEAGTKFEVYRKPANVKDRGALVELLSWHYEYSDNYEDASSQQ